MNTILLNEKKIIKHCIKNLNLVASIFSVDTIILHPETQLSGGNVGKSACLGQQAISSSSSTRPAHTTSIIMYTVHTCSTLCYQAPRCCQAHPILGHCSMKTLLYLLSLPGHPGKQCHLHADDILLPHLYLMVTLLNAIACTDCENFME